MRHGWLMVNALWRVKMTMMNLDKLEVWLRENVRFCYIACGSLTEVQSHIAVAHDLGFLPDEIY